MRSSKLQRETIRFVNSIWRHSQAVRQRSAKPSSPVRFRVAPPRNPTEIDTISVGFSLPRNAKNALIGRFFGICVFTKEHADAFSVLQNHFKAFFAQKLEPPRGSVSEYRTIILSGWFYVKFSFQIVFLIFFLFVLIALITSCAEITPTLLIPLSFYNFQKVCSVMLQECCTNSKS